MTTITGKIESAAGETLHARISFQSRSTPQFPPGIVEVNTVKVIKSNASTGEFSVQLAAGNYRVIIRAKNLDTVFDIAVPEGDDTFSIEDLVTSVVSALPGAAPYTIWNGQRAGHITFVPIADPLVPTWAPVDYPGSHIAVANYYYKISYVTQEGETAPSAALLVAYGGAGEEAIRLALAVNPTRVISKKIWRNLDTDDADNLYLLAEVAPEVAHYDDWESHADFAARADLGTIPATFNTTAGVIFSSPGAAQLYFSSSGLRCLAAAKFDLPVTIGGLGPLEAASLDVNGAFSCNHPDWAAFIRALTISQTLIIPSDAAAGYVLTSDADGLASWQPPSGGTSGIFGGAADPEGSQAAPINSIYNQIVAGVFVKQWIKVAGSGNTGWQ